MVEPAPRAASVVLLAMLGSACGYQFGAGNRAFEADVRTIGVRTLVNETREIGVEKRLAMAIEREFVIRGPLKVTKADEGDLVLSGTVKSAEDRPVAFNRDDEVLIYQTILALDLELRRRDSGKLRLEGARPACRGRLRERGVGGRDDVVRFPEVDVEPGGSRRLHRHPARGDAPARDPGAHDRHVGAGRLRSDHGGLLSGG